MVLKVRYWALSIDAVFEIGGKIKYD